MNSNRIQIVDRELAVGGIEGVYFGPKVWVIARSPTAVLMWVYGFSSSVNGHQSYEQPHLTLLPDRTPRFMFKPNYASLRAEWTRLTSRNAEDYHHKIASAFGLDAMPSIYRAIDQRMTAVIDGGGGQLLPPNCYGDDFHEWKARGGGFIVLPEGMTEHDACRGKLGWKPKEKA